MNRGLSSLVLIGIIVIAIIVGVGVYAFQDVSGFVNPTIYERWTLVIVKRGSQWILYNTIVRGKFTEVDNSKIFIDSKRLS